MAQLYTKTRIHLNGLNAQKDVDIQLMSSLKGSADVTRILLTRVDEDGVAYTENSLSLELFQRQNVNSNNPVSGGGERFYYRTNIEPASTANGGLAFDKSLEAPREITNRATNQVGKISARLKRLGGNNVDSQEDYDLQIWAEGE